MRYNEVKVSVYENENGTFGIRRDYYDDGDWVSSDEADTECETREDAENEAEQYVDIMGGEDSYDETNDRERTYTLVK